MASSFSNQHTPRGILPSARFNPISKLIISLITSNSKLNLPTVDDHNKYGGESQWTF
jgi:hypothetical protein